MAYISRVIFILAVITPVRVQDEDSDPNEVMIAQESRNIKSIFAPPVRIIKPNGVTNSHRPQYNLDSLEEDFLPDLDVLNLFEVTTRTNLHKTHNPYNSKYKVGMIRDAVLRALERKDYAGKFAQILPIIRAMSGNQRVTLASLVASQISTPPGREPLNLSQVRSIFGNENNSTTELMLPILLDMANLVRRAVRPGKEQRDVKLPLTFPQTQFLRRSFFEDTSQSDEFDPGVEIFQPIQTTTTKPFTLRNRITRNKPQRSQLTTNKLKQNLTTDIDKNTAQDNQTVADNVIQRNTKYNSNATSIKNTTEYSTSTNPTSTEPTGAASARGSSRALADNATDLMAESTNQTLQEMPVAEKLRALNRFVARTENGLRRGTYSPKLISRYTTAEPPSLSTISRRRPFPVRKPPPQQIDEDKCELFTNTVCLHSEDYPTEAIVQSIRRNKAATGALLVEFKDPGQGALDGITPAQEAKYTTEHRLASNRRGDNANTEFASAGEAGFMCPSTVKYARPQRARATSGQWKYIVNTGEHTQTLRLEKCLKPKESCSYLTDNFKSKCVQVYNYHRLLTWDQQVGLHMDIFKIPTCCSCHIEGYSVSFPPLGHRIHETSSEFFPGDDLFSEKGIQGLESIQSAKYKPAVKKPPSKPLDAFQSFSENHNSLPGPLFADTVSDDDFNNVPTHNLKDSYGNLYFSDSLNYHRNVRKPSNARNPLGGDGFNTATLPSYLEPPTPSGASSFSYSKDSSNKYKNSDSLFKRGISRQNYRPIRKKITASIDDLVSSGTSAVGAISGNLGNEEDLTANIQNSDTRKTNPSINVRATITPKLQALSTLKPFTTTTRPEEPNQITKENIISNSKRVNYNYHPIIDFFEEVETDGNESIDREDNVPEFIPSAETQWKPINHPVTTA